MYAVTKLGNFRKLGKSRKDVRKQESTALKFRDPNMLGWVIALPIIGTYVITSVVLLNFPWLVHKKKQSKFRCRHISHRGGEFEFRN